MLFVVEVVLVEVEIVLYYFNPISHLKAIVSCLIALKILKRKKILQALPP